MACRVYIRGQEHPFHVVGTPDQVLTKLTEHGDEPLTFVELELEHPAGEVVRLNPFSVDAITQKPDVP